MCKKLNVAPLDFNGEEDAVFQQYNNDGENFMEYVEDYGHFEDVPLQFIYENMMAHYKGLGGKLKGGQFIIE